MVEFIKHITGCCGEGHPSLLVLLGIPAFFIMMRNQIKNVFKVFKIIVKSCLERLGWLLHRN